MELGRITGMQSEYFRLCIHGCHKMFIALTPGGSAYVRVCTGMHTHECVGEEKRCFLLGPHAKTFLVITYIKNLHS